LNDLSQELESYCYASVSWVALGALCTYCVGLYGCSPGIHCRILFLDIKLPLTKHYHKVCSAAYRFKKTDYWIKCCGIIVGAFGDGWILILSDTVFKYWMPETQ